MKLQPLERVAGLRLTRLRRRGVQPNLSVLDTRARHPQRIAPSPSRPLLPVAETGLPARLFPDVDRDSTDFGSRRPENPPTLLASLPPKPAPNARSPLRPARIQRGTHRMQCGPLVRCLSSWRLQRGLGQRPSVRIPPNVQHVPPTGASVTADDSKKCRCSQSGIPSRENTVVRACEKLTALDDHQLELRIRAT